MFADHDVQDDAEAPDVVCRAVVRNSLENLGRGVGRAAAVRLAQLVGLLRPREPEVGQLDVVVDVEQHVLALEVSGPHSTP